MPKPIRLDKSVYRICDANLNRAKEGLRVCEEIARFTLNNRRLTAEFKSLRHKIDGPALKLSSKHGLCGYRNSPSDVGKKIHTGEFKKNTWEDILSANMQRAKESVRVLEEFSRLIDRGAAIGFKYLRYDIYDTEKKTNRLIGLYKNRHDTARTCKE